MQDIFENVERLATLIAIYFQVPQKFVFGTLNRQLITTNLIITIIIRKSITIVF